MKTHIDSCRAQKHMPSAYHGETRHQVVKKTIPAFNKKIFILRILIEPRADAGIIIEQFFHSAHVIPEHLRKIGAQNSNRRIMLIIIIYREKLSHIIELRQVVSKQLIIKK